MQKIAGHPAKFHSTGFQQELGGHCKDLNVCFPLAAAVSCDINSEAGDGQKHGETAVEPLKPHTSHPSQLAPLNG